MEINICSCGVHRTDLFMRLQYYCKISSRWRCQVCVEKQQGQHKKLKKDLNKIKTIVIYANQKNAQLKFDKDVSDLTIKRRNLVINLHKLFNQMHFSSHNKHAQEISKINTLFLDLIDNPLSQSDLQGLEEIQLNLLSRFNKLSEQEIQNFLSIGRGNYQCDNKRFQEILTIMQNIEEIRVSTLAIKLELIVKNSEKIEYFNQELNDNLQLSCIKNNLIYFIGLELQQILDEYLFIENNYIYDLNNKTLTQIDQNIQDFQHFDQTSFSIKIGQKNNYVQQIRDRNSQQKKQSEKYFLKSNCLLDMAHINNFLFMISQQHHNKTLIFSFQSRKSIRISKLNFLNKFDKENNFLVNIEDYQLSFYKLSSFKHEIKLELPILLRCKLIKLLLASKKVICEINNNLYIYDIDYRNNQLTNCQILNYQVNYYRLNDYNNLIIIFTLDRIVILDQHLSELKCIDFNLKQIPITYVHIDGDMKCLYIQSKIKKQNSIYQITFRD